MGIVIGVVTMPTKYWYWYWIFLMTSQSIGLVLGIVRAFTDILGICVKNLVLLTSATYVLWGVLELILVSLLSWHEQNIC